MTPTYPHSPPVEQGKDARSAMVAVVASSHRLQDGQHDTPDGFVLVDEKALLALRDVLVAFPPAPQAEGEIERLRLRLDYEWGVCKEFVTRFSHEEQKLICAALRSAQAPADSEADMRAFSAADAACYKWPDDNTEHKNLRAAYIEGAADYGAPTRTYADGIEDAAKVCERVASRYDLQNNNGQVSCYRSYGQSRKWGRWYQY